MIFEMKYTLNARTHLIINFYRLLNVIEISNFGKIGLPIFNISLQYPEIRSALASFHY